MSELQRILVADDSPTELFLYGGWLRDAGYRVLEVSDGRRALQEARRWQPDLILMDIVMPGLNGFQATRELKRCAATAQIPVIVISSKQQQTDRLWAQRQGAANYLVKPLLQPEMLAAVAAIWSV